MYGWGVRRWFSAYNTVCDDKTKLKYYLPEEIYYTHIDSFLSKPIVTRYFDDKCLYDLYFHDVLMPKTLLRIMSGNYLDDKYQNIAREDIFELMKNQKSVVCKESVCSVGGKGVVFFDFEKDSLDSFMDYLEKENELIIQAVIKQHPILGGLHSSSINTIRVMTLYNNGK